METDAYRIGSSLSSNVVFEGDIQLLYNGFTKFKKILFLRGFFDTNGKVVKALCGLESSMKITDNALKAEVRIIAPLPCVETDDTIAYYGVNAQEFLHILYKEADYPLHNHNYASYRDILYCWKPTVQYLNEKNLSKLQYSGHGASFKFTKTLPNAIAPCKAHITDSGFDLCLIQKVKEDDTMILYDTGIAIQPPIGYYFELVGRSSISKTGYIVANSVGIIDASYTGSIKVALIKIHKEAPDIELPARLVQLIPRQFIHLEPEEVLELDVTKRADGGFGSSGNSALLLQ
jgi:deoxyuridine 5'-triphosphate nucleotidohydrolase